MAFATSSVRRENSGSQYVLSGSWTGTYGDASGSVTGKGYCSGAVFNSNTTTGPKSPIRPTISNSSGDWTVTVPFFETVTAGTFQITFK